MIEEDRPPTIDPAANYIIGERVVAYHVAFARVLKSATAALMLSQLFYWSNTPTVRDRDGWFYKTASEIEEETGLTRREQETARRILRDFGVIAEERRGLPAKLWFRLNKEQLFALTREYVVQYGGKRQTSFTESAKLDEPNPPIKNGAKRASTSETTSEDYSQKLQQQNQTSDVVRTGSKISVSRQNAELVRKVMALTGDESSIKRYRQLLGIAWDTGHVDLWDAAYKATESRLRKSAEPLDSAGAYFCSVLVKLLNNEGVRVPVGTPEQRADVRAQIAASLNSADCGAGA